MQIGSSSAATSGMALQAMRDLFQTQPTQTTGQFSPSGSSSKSEKSRPPPPPPPPPPAASSGGGFSADTLSALLQTQEAASSVIDEADTNGDGTVSLSELAASLGTDEASVKEAFARVDADADGQINAGELEAGLEAAGGPQGRRGPPPSSADIATTLLAAADTDGGGSLSLGEISTALGGDDSSSLFDAFAALDSNGDGGLGVNELTSAVESLFAQRMAAYTAHSGGGTATSRSLAA